MVTAGFFSITLPDILSEGTPAGHECHADQALNLSVAFVFPSCFSIFAFIITVFYF